ncbi:MAG TPA: VWA domain-containing protein [Vicinamibacterales bacterium]|nr:VWA domain-containing protein [Vicinamibacterales bacterium]
MSLRLIAAAALLAGPVLSAQQPAPPPQGTPRFRAGANLVRLDAYVAADGAALTDLTVQDFDVLEDNVPQRVESFELIKPRGPASQSARVEPNTVAESRAMATDRDSRLFILFMDIAHVHLAGSFRAQAPISNLLNKVIGQDDMVGVMTTEMSARNLTLARRTSTIDSILKDYWYWGERDAVQPRDPREQEILSCYSDNPARSTAGIAEEMIERRRERKTLDSIDDLITHLEGVREERKFVVMLSEGWVLPGRNDQLSRALDGNVPSVSPIAVGPTGKLTTEDPRKLTNLDSCERERLRLASEDLQTDFRLLLQRANRANISFYTVDPRGLTAFDADLSSRRALNIGRDQARLSTRQDSLRELAENTDGVAIVNTNNVSGGLERMVQDTGAYYLLGYYSTNTRLDGKFRKISVRVKRPDAKVRARPGYLAPTEAEAASSRVDALMKGAAAGHSSYPPGFARALETLTPVRGVVPVRVQVTASPSQIWLTTELDAATAKQPEWLEGGRARVSFEHESGAAARAEVDVTLAPGQRAFSVTPPAGTAVASGRYVIRVQVTPKHLAVPLQTTVEVSVPERSALISATGLAARRGPSTGLQYVSTADARFRRTERLRLEVPRLSESGTVSARLLGRDAQPIAVGVTLSERVDATASVRMIVADLTLAPLAQGDYVVEIAMQAGDKKETASYAFRLVP